MVWRRGRCDWMRIEETPRSLSSSPPQRRRGGGFSHRFFEAVSLRYSDTHSKVPQRMSGGKIRIRMEAYDHQALDASAREIVDHAKRTGARVAGPIPLPTRREIYTVNRSPFIDKKSREQFEIRTHKRIIDISEPNHRTVEALNRLVVPAGVFVKIKA